MPTPTSSAELKSFRKALARWREDMNDRADELAEQLAALEEKATGKKPKPKDEEKPKGEGDGEDEDEEEEDESSWP